MNGTFPMTQEGYDFLKQEKLVEEGAGKGGREQGGGAGRGGRKDKEK